MKWKLALVQHPMYLLIREDTTCAERTPPWGAPTIDAYIDRVEQNLESLEKFLDLKLGYEWSAVELELLAIDSPSTFEKLKKYAEKGRISFYNGTYSQPHLQILSSEANIRQYELGKSTYKELGLQEVKVYAHQEASVHDQVPQLLRAFGIPLAVVPGFLTTLVWLGEGELLLHGVRGPRFIQGQEFVNWKGLDGTDVPLFLHQPIPREMTLRETLTREVVLDKLGAPPLFIDLPDMIGINEDWIEERKVVEFSLLDDELNARLLKNPPNNSVRLFTNWSYIEGIRAEELSRSNLNAEREVLRAEAMISLAWVLRLSDAKSTKSIWKTILKYQHHDVYCFSAPELREKAIGWLKDAANEATCISNRCARIIASKIHTDCEKGQPLVVFSTVPHKQLGIVEIVTEIPNPEIFDLEGNSLKSEAFPLENGKFKMDFELQSDGLGYSTFWIRSGTNKLIAEKCDTSYEFSNPYYHAVIDPNGTFSSLKLTDVGIELINETKGAGNSISATDSSRISLLGASQEERIEKYLSDPTYRGDSLKKETIKPAIVWHTSLGAIFNVSFKMGERIHADLIIHFYQNLPRIDITYNFNFEKASVGTFFDEDSKLLLSWPLTLDGTIYHDIPFGVIQEKDDRPFFPTNWTDYSDGEQGIAFFHQGTPKHWFSDHTLHNLLGWGEETDAIHNGLGHYQWLKSFDQRLDGKHVLKQSVLPHLGDWRTADLPREALALGMPPFGILTDSHPGDLHPSLSLLQLPNANNLTTSIQIQYEQLICRIYGAYGKVTKPEGFNDWLELSDIRLLQGDRVEEIGEYQIGELVYNRIPN